MAPASAPLSPFTTTPTAGRAHQVRCSPGSRRRTHFRCRSRSGRRCATRSKDTETRHQPGSAETVDDDHSPDRDADVTNAEHAVHRPTLWDGEDVSQCQEAWVRERG